jgi:hypothetical protein
MRSFTHAARHAGLEPGSRPFERNAALIGVPAQGRDGGGSFHAQSVSKAKRVSVGKLCVSFGLLALASCAPAPLADRGSDKVPPLEQTLGPEISAKFVGIDAEESSVGAIIRQKYSLASADFWLSGDPDISESRLCLDQYRRLVEAIGKRKAAEANNLRLAFTWPLTATLEAYRVSFMSLDDCELIEVNG